MRNDYSFGKYFLSALCWAAFLGTAPAISAQTSSSPEAVGNRVNSPLIEFNDPVLEEKIKKILGKGPMEGVSVAEAEKIRSLNISSEYNAPGNTKVHKIDALRHFVRLQNLTADYNVIKSIEPLKFLKELRFLKLTGNRISNLSPLSGLLMLTNIDLSYNDRIANLKPLGGLINVTNLYIARSRISNVQPLSGLTKLTDLDLMENKLYDISPLASLKNLEMLWIASNNIKNPEAIQPLKNNLKTLSLSNCFITDISFLSGFTGLRDLILMYNYISDLSPITHLTQLETLLVNSNQISSMDDVVSLVKEGGLAQKKSRYRTNLDLSNNAIFYFSVENRKNKAFLTEQVKIVKF